MKEALARYGTLAAATAAFIGGALDAATQTAATVLYTAGLILLGVWITMEIRYQLLRKESDDDDT